MRFFRTTSCLLCLLWMMSCGSQKNKDLEIPLTEVRQGTFYIDLYEEGDVQSTQSRIVSSPDISWRYGNNLKIATLIEDGSAVEDLKFSMSFFRHLAPVFLGTPATVIFSWSPSLTQYLLAPIVLN